MTTKEKINTYRTIATIVGIVVGIVGNTMSESILDALKRLTTISATSLTVTIGAIL